ncbi:MAG TPA: hypothetical protein DHW02_16120 [Ktedonobacter sp.]|nr:hypothetical protein [Ktedonobacter sp.]
MLQTQTTSTTRHSYASQPSLMFFSLTVFFGIFLSTVFITGIYFSLEHILGSSPLQITRHAQAHMDIIINQPGMHKDWPAYSTDNLTLPQYSYVTITIRNYDLGDTPLPANSPYNKVQGTVGDSASVDGTVYKALAEDKVAHTFTVSGLNLNVPIPGDGLKGASYNTVTFTIKTGAAGTYTFQCYDPCGTGMSGWNGPMMTPGYMTGTIIIQ